ncbi:hypothetical protein ACO0R3_000668 [Hanseniaspora guilliermondii]
MFTNNFIHDKQQTNDSLFQDSNAETLSTSPINVTSESSVSVANNALTKALHSVNLSSNQLVPNNKSTGSHLHTLSNSRPSNIKMRRDKSNIINNPSNINGQYLRSKSPIPRAKSNSSEMDDNQYSFPALSIIYQNKEDENAETSEKCYELIKFISTIHDKSKSKLNNYWDINPVFNNSMYFDNEMINKGMDQLSAKFILENRIRIDLNKISYLLKIDKKKPLKDWHKLLFIEKLPSQFERQINTEEKFQSLNIGSGACGDVLKLQVLEEIHNKKENKSRCEWPLVGTFVACKRFLPRALNQNVRSFYEKVIIEYETMKLVYYASKKFNLNKHFLEVYGLFVDDIDGVQGPIAATTSDESKSQIVDNLNYTPYNPHEDVKIYQVSLNKFPQFSMVTEYAPCDLITILPKLSDHKKQCVFKQLCVVVFHLHYNMNMIHRDIKLDNILLTDKGIIKLIDFGNANLLSTSSDLVKGILGSDAYLAPEVLLSPHSYNGKPVDVWACAIVFISMWLNKFPWKVGHTDDVGFALFSQEPNNGAVSISKYGKDRLEYTTDNYHTWLGDDYGMSTVKANNSNGVGTNYLTKKSLEEDEYGTWLGDDYGQNNNNVHVIDEATDISYDSDPFGLVVIDDAVRGKNFLLKQLPANVRPIIEKMLILDNLERHNMREVVDMEEFKLVECCLGY